MTGSPPILVVSLNPAIDQTLVVSGFRAGAVHRVQADHHHAGGKAVNVALTLAALKQPVIITGFLGEPNAAIFKKAFADAGIQNRCIPVPQPTRHGIKIVDPTSGKTTDLNFPGFEIDSNHFEALTSRLVKTPWNSTTVMSGSLPTGCPDDTYPRLMRMAAFTARGGIALDTSGPALVAGVAAGPRIIKPNLEELKILAADEQMENASVVAIARRLIERHGIRRVVVSMGADGATLVEAAGVWHATPPTVKVVSTVGAGDAMMAGLIIAEREGWDAVRTLRFATALGADTVTRFGSGGCDLAQIEALAKTILPLPGTPGRGQG